MLSFPLFLLALTLQTAKAQNFGSQITSEIGAGIGGLSYTGDLVRGYDFTLNRPAGTVFYRSNLSKSVSFRAALTAGNLVGEEEPIDILGSRRGASFDVFLFEASATMEYHFLNWRDENYRIRWTPYLFGGIGLFGISGEGERAAEYSAVQPAIPLGAGIKYILNPKWYIGFEFGARKTFFDYLDNVSGSDPTLKNFQHGAENDNDMYYYLGFSITYSFYNIPCPTSPYK